MRIFLSIVFTCALSVSFSQGRYTYDEKYSYDYQYNLEDYKRKYPYVKRYSPSFLGLIVGYNMLKNREVELGLAYNLFEGPTDLGMTAGYQLLYKRSLEREQNAVDLELGVYGLLSTGISVNYTFSNDISAFGFKPFIGTSVYHFQLLYGYNFLRKKKQEWYQLSRHSLTIRYVIPLKANKQTYYYLPPAPDYRGLKGLHKDHPVKTPEYRYRKYLY